MFKLNIYNTSPNCLADLLPWVCLIAPGIILNKDGSLQRTCRFRGPDLDSESAEGLLSAMTKLNNMLKRLGSGWALYVEARRESVTYETSSSYFPEPISLLIDVEHHKRFSERKGSYESYYYLTWQYLPGSDLKSSLGRSFIKQANQIQNEDNKSLVYFNEQTEQLFNILKELCFEAELLSDAETLSYLHEAISLKKQKIAIPRVPIYLDALLADTPLLTGLEPKLGEAFIKTVSIIGFPADSIPAILDRLNHLPFQYRWMSRFIALDKLDAEKQLKRHRQRWFSKRKSLANLLQEVLTKQESSLQDSSAMEKSKEVDEALQLLGNESVSYGYFTCTVVVMNEDLELAKQQQKEVEQVIHSLGFTTIAETINALEAWLSSIPGHAYANVRKPLLHSMNLSHLIPYSAIWSGQKKDKHLNASPLFHAYTYGGSLFSFVLHHGDVGHHMIIGPTGSGKSLLLNFIACQFRRYLNAKVVIFDKGKSFLTLTKALGGQFFEFEENGLHFQPLANIDIDEEMQWASHWLKDLFEFANLKVTPEIKSAIWQALKDLSLMPKEQRTIYGFSLFLQDQKLRKAISEYTLEGQFKEILDSTNDNLVNSNWSCFEMEALMSKPQMVAPVLTYIFHWLEKNFLGEPSLLILDEAWLFLDHPVFVDKIKDWLKSLRKKNVSVIFATQSVSDAAKHRISATLLESCPGRVFLPNSRAEEPLIKSDYLQLGLNEQQISLLSYAQAKKHYYYQSNLGNCLFSLEIGQVALAFCGSSKQEEIKFAQEHMNLDSLSFSKKVLENKKISWAAKMLEEVNFSDKR